MLIFASLSSCATFWKKSYEVVNPNYKSKIESLNLVFLRVNKGEQNAVQNTGKIYINKEWKIPGAYSAILHAKWYVDTIKEAIAKSANFNELNVIETRLNNKDQYTLEFNKIVQQGKKNHTY